MSANPKTCDFGRWWRRRFPRVAGLELRAVSWAWALKHDDRGLLVMREHGRVARVIRRWSIRRKPGRWTRTDATTLKRQVNR